MTCGQGTTATQLVLRLLLILSALTLPAFANTIHVPADQPTIQAGINAANPGDTVLVAPGTYYENIDFKGKAITVTSSAGAATTIIDGGAAPGVAVVTFQSNETRSSVLSNMTIRNGGPVTFNSYSGGGIYIYESSPTILSNFITANQCDGIVAASGAPLIQGNNVNGTLYAEDAFCAFQPVAIVISGGGPNTALTTSVIGNVIEKNASSSGTSNAAIFVWDSNGDIILGNTIRDNISSEGAVQVFNSESIIFSQNLVYNNSLGTNINSSAGSSGLYLLVPETTSAFYGIIANNTFANNTLSSNLIGASQVYIDGDVGQYVFVNNILYGTGRSPLLICSAVYSYLSPTPMQVENNDVYNPSGPAYDTSCANGAGVAGNVSVDPIFNNLATDDLHLQSGSPAIDAGNNQALSLLLPYGVSLPTDLDGNPRIQDATGKGCVIDMGVYEYPGNLTACGTIETLTSSLNPSTVGQSVTFTAQLSSSSGVPTGSVEFLDSGNMLATQPVSPSGTSTYNTSSLAIGSHTITANFQPTGTFPAVSATLTQTVNAIPTNTAFACTPNPASPSTPILLKAVVTSLNGTPDGTVTFYETNAFGTIALANGEASLTIPPLPAGTHNLSATFTPPAASNFARSLATCQVVVNGLPSTAVLKVSPQTAAYGSPVTLNATVSATTPPGPAPLTGTITFYNSGSTVGQATLSAGTASLPLTNVPVGTDQLTCQYSGDSIYSPSPCNIVPVTIKTPLTTLILAASPNPAYAFQPLTLTAHISSANGTPAGTITFLSNSTSLGSAPISSAGVATFTASLPAGNDTLSAAYVSTNTSIGSSATSNLVTEVITPDTTTSTLTISPTTAPQGTAIAITAQVAPSHSQTAPSGTITFLDGTTTLAKVPVSATGGATFSSSTFSVGTHTLTAVYSGSPNDLTSISAAKTLTITPQNFTLTAPPSLTLRTGHHANMAFTLASIGGFSDTVALTCTTLPQWATCNIANANPSLAANQTVSATLYFDTDAVIGYESELRTPFALRTGLAAALLLPLGLLATPRRRSLLRRPTLVLALLITASFFSLTGCSGLYPPSTPPGTYTITLTGQGTQTAQTHTTTFTLIVTP